MNLITHWMNLALREAEQAFAEDEVPVGAVVVHAGQLLGRGHNQTRTLNDPTAHAEILAITAACQKLSVSRLETADLYVTLEPCAMCAGAIVLAKVSRLFYGAGDPKTGACGSVFDIVREPRLNHQVEVYPGICEKESAALLEKFFKMRRNNGID
ncbi:MAG: tRNA adenosine(34) deaminase TadA [Calditrichota bacterium]